MHLTFLRGFPGGPVVKKKKKKKDKKNLSANAGDTRDTSSISGLGKSPRGGHGNSLLYSCLENSIEREAWQVTGHGVTKSQI